MANFSSYGPTLDGRLKPNVSAPGVNVESALSSFPRWRLQRRKQRGIRRRHFRLRETVWDEHEQPAAAGVVALMLEANPELTPGDVRTILEWTAREDEDTGALPEDGDHVWGHGKVTASRAVAAAIDWVSGVAEWQADLPAFSVFPNPAVDDVWVTSKATRSGRWTLFNMQGQSVRSGMLTPWFKIALDGLPDGMFMLAVETEAPIHQHCPSSNSVDARAVILAFASRQEAPSNFVPCAMG